MPRRSTTGSASTRTTHPLSDATADAIGSVVGESAATPPPETVPPEIVITVPGWPPSKSNLNRIGLRNGHPILFSAANVKAYADAMLTACRTQLQRQGYHITWECPGFTRRGTPKKPRPLNPYFGPNIEVDVYVALAEPYRTARDTDGVLKVLCDVLTSEGIWTDDRQMGDLHISRRAHVHVHADEGVTIRLVPVVPASWTRNPTGTFMKPLPAGSIIRATPASSASSRTARDLIAKKPSASPRLRTRRTLGSA